MIKSVYGKRYMLVVNDRFSNGVETAPIKDQSVTIIIKFLSRKVKPRCEIQLEIRSDNGSAFIWKTVKSVVQQSHIKQRLGYVYHPQSQGKVKRMNQTLKGKIGKIGAHSKLSWLEALPLALMSTRSSVNSATGVQDLELGGVTAPPTPFLTYKPYYDQLTALVAAFSKQVSVIQGGAEQAPKDTEWVLLKVIKRKWSDPRWTGPYRVIERTSHAVRLDGKAPAVVWKQFHDRGSATTRASREPDMLGTDPGRNRVPELEKEPPRGVEPGDQLYLRCSGECGTSPGEKDKYKVTNATPTVIEVEGSSTWYHLNHCTKAAQPKTREDHKEELGAGVPGTDRPPQDQTQTSQEQPHDDAEAATTTIQMEGGPTRV
ncbi:Gag-Pol polyprotein [Merluccius polli]|uniref:Gag-Pol polyprotein n=1 Tax=Merluccius polli TaxID=89951 RepID=A0AA47M706_MERPO|nr:Gag-Pol polyprotein [Merluccius polli]